MKKQEIKNYEFVNEVNGYPVPKGAKSIKIKRDNNVVIYTFIYRNGSINVHQIVEGSIDKLKRTIKDIRDKGIFNNIIANVFNANGYACLPGYNHVSNKFLGI